MLTQLPGKHHRRTMAQYGNATWHKTDVQWHAIVRLFHAIARLFRAISCNGVQNRANPAKTVQSRAMVCHCMTNSNYLPLHANFCHCTPRFAMVRKRMPLHVCRVSRENLNALFRTDVGDIEKISWFFLLLLNIDVG